MTRRTNFLALAALLWGLLFCASCNRSSRRTIAVIPKATAHLFWQSVQAGAIAAGREYHVEVLWNGPPTETDYSRQIEILDSMIARHVDGIAVAAQDRNGLERSLARAAAANIPVTVFDSGVDSNNYMTFLATNNYEAGQMAARKLAGLLGGKGNIGIVMHTPGSRSSMDREQGFQDTLAKEYPGIHVVATQYGMSDQAKAMAAAENILTAHPDIAGLFASAEPSSAGTSLAIKERGLSGRIHFVAFDTTDALIEDLKAGTIDALIAQDPFRIGHEAVRTLVDKLDGKTPPRNIDLHAVVVTRADLSRPEIHALLFPDIHKYLN